MSIYRVNSRKPIELLKPIGQKKMPWKIQERAATPSRWNIGTRRLKSKNNKPNNNKPKQPSKMKRNAKMHLSAKASTFRNAKKLRAKMTPAEELLWAAIKNKQLDGLKFRRQHPISRYVLDFYCARAKLGIEVDGKYHEEKAQKLYDADRTENLKLSKIKIIRFTNEEIFNQLVLVLESIKEETQARISNGPVH